MKMRTNGKAENPVKSETESSGGSKVGPFLLGAIVGAVVGGTLALIYAPAEGSELRRKMTETFDDIADGVADLIQSAKSASDRIFNEGRNIVDDAGSKADEVIDRTREKVDDILEGADRAIAEARKRSSQSEYSQSEEEH